VAEKVGLGEDVGNFFGYTEAQRANMKHAPPAERTDGNRCEDDEEEFEGLCYKQCRLLTGGAYPVRTSSWTCWKGGDSSKIFAEKYARKVPVPCTDYDVAGDIMGGGCPHSPGACLTNEELHLDYCYEKCSVLTGNQYPYRFAAATCCKVEGMHCLAFWNSKTSQDFRVGGGSGELAKVHLPVKRLTEAQRAAAHEADASTTPKATAPITVPVAPV